MGIVHGFPTRRPASIFFYFTLLLALLATGCQSGDGDHPSNPPANPPNGDGQPPLKAPAAVHTITNNGTVYFITNTFGAGYTITNRPGDTFTITNVGTVMTNAVSTNGIILVVSTNVTYTSWKSSNTYSNSISFWWANSGCPKVRWLQFVSYAVIPSNAVPGNLPGTDPKAPPKKQGSWYVDTRTNAPDPFYDSNAGADDEGLYDSPQSFGTLRRAGATSVIQN